MVPRVAWRRLGLKRRFTVPKVSLNPNIFYRCAGCNKPCNKQMSHFIYKLGRTRPLRNKRTQQRDLKRLAPRIKQLSCQTCHANFTRNFLTTETCRSRVARLISRQPLPDEHHVDVSLVRCLVDILLQIKVELKIGEIRSTD